MYTLSEIYKQPFLSFSLPLSLRLTERMSRGASTRAKHATSITKQLERQRERPNSIEYAAASYLWLACTDAISFLCSTFHYKREYNLCFLLLYLQSLVQRDSYAPVLRTKNYCQCVADYVCVLKARAHIF